MNPYDKLDKRIILIRKQTKLPLNKTSLQYYALVEFMKKTDKEIIESITSNLTGYRIYVSEKHLRGLRNNGMR